MERTVGRARAAVNQRRDGYNGWVIYKATVEQTKNGDYAASCEDPEVSVQGLSPTNALDRLRSEIRYRIELCPCSGVEEDYVELEVADGGGL